MNTDITFLPADKGNVTVVLNTVHYYQKTGAVLRDRDDLRLTKDPIEAVETKTSLLF